MLPLPQWFDPARVAGQGEPEPEHRRVFAEFARMLAGVIARARRG